MEKIANFLHNMAMHGSQEADDLYWEIKDLDNAAFSRWVLDNDERLRAVIPFKSIMEEPSEEEKALLSEYIGARNAGVKAYTGDKKTDVYGRPLKGVDEFMQAFGVKPSNDVELRDNDRSAFTNPENPNYWEKRPYSDKVMAAYNLGYGTVDEMENDLRRSGSDYQRANQVEGYGPNNEKQPWEWTKSALKGLALPRTKEAQVSGREPTVQDYAGDAIETGVSLVPGFGLFSKGGRVMRGAGMVLDNAGVPLATNLIDSKFLYNPNTLGTPTSGLNPRSEFDPLRVATQAAGIVGSKGALKGTAMMGKDAFEKFYGSKPGGESFKSGLSFIENIGENTDDLIARRQVALDRKAELAKQRRNVGFETDNDIPAGNANVADMQAAETYRILDSEAQRLANSQGARAAYRDAIAKDRALESAGEKIEDAYAPLEKIGKILPENFVVDESKYIVMPVGNKYKLAIPAGTDPDVIYSAINEMRERLDKLNSFRNTPEGQQAAAAAAAWRAGAVPEQAKVLQDYVTANETSPIEGQLLQLPDGNLVNSSWVTRRGDEWRVSYPGSDYEVKLAGKPTPLSYQYEKTYDPGMNINKIYGRKPVEGELSRNQVVREKILQDDLLSRRLNTVQNPTYKLPSEKLHIGPQTIRLDRIERPRDILSSWGFNAASREGFLGRNNTASIDEKRERAIWNKMLNALSPLTTNPELPVETRKRNADAIMNVMQYGLDGLPEEIFLQAPETYHRIAKELKVDNWKHYTETNPQPTPSSSRTK